VALTIRNKRIEDEVRALGESWGEGPTGVLARLIERSRRLADMEREAEKARRLAAWEKLMADFPPPTAEEKAAMQRVMDEMYDEDGLPR
jgi:hypothetical protein